MATSGVQTRLPTVGELLIYTWDASAQANLIEVAFPGQTASFDFAASDLSTQVANLLSSKTAEIISMTARPSPGLQIGCRFSRIAEIKSRAATTCPLISAPSSAIGSGWPTPPEVMGTHLRGSSEGAKGLPASKCAAGSLSVRKSMIPLVPIS